MQVCLCGISLALVVYFAFIFQIYFCWVWNSSLTVFSSSALNIMLHCFLACIVSREKICCHPYLPSPACLFVLGALRFRLYYKNKQMGPS